MLNLKGAKHAQFAAVAGAAVAALALALPAQALPIVNGGFETSTNGLGEVGSNTNITGWSQGPALTPSNLNGAYNFLFDAPSVNGAGSPGVDSSFGPNTVKLWSVAPSPDGGRFFGSDGDQTFNQNGGISQTVTGLTAGASYLVTFYQAGAQQFGFDGITTERWRVSLGNSAPQFSPLLTNASHGFTGWSQVSMVFTAASTSEVLTFLAFGTPNGVPPFALLDGITMNLTTVAVPEPGSLALVALAMLGIPALRKYGKRKA